MDIAFIAPFERIRINAQSIIDTSNYPARTYLGDLDKGVEATKRALQEGAKIIISRGGTARLIQQQLDIEVIEVEGSIHRALAFINKNTSPKTKIAIVGFRQLINLVDPICNILGRSSQPFEVKDALSFTKVIDEVEHWRPDIVIGDAVSFHWAKDRGLKAYLIESSMETIEESFERAMLVLNHINRHFSNEKKLSVVLNCTKEGAVLVNRDGSIEEINQQACEILAITKSQLIGTALSNYLVSNELKTAFKKGQLARNIVLNYKEKSLALDHIPISIGEVGDSSAVILFQQIDKIQETGNAIRKKLLDTGFYAKYTFADIKHCSKQLASLVEVSRQYSASDKNIMIQGETGTGKELFAQSIHNAGPLSDGPFVAVNCAALSGTLLESELFGYAPGAFTGALRSGKIGLFELAQEGTLFLDELAEMDIFLQSKLLRVLQTRQIRRVGGAKVISIKVRVIAATNKVPLEEVRNGRLRADLYYRLSVLDLQIPPLRERDGDPEFLFTYYLKKHSSQSGQIIQQPSTKLMNTISNYPWPGNVRELENFAEKYVTLQKIKHHGTLDSALFVPDASTAPSMEKATLNEIIHANVVRVYRQENGNVTKTAKRLSIDRNTVKRWLKKLNK